MRVWFASAIAATALAWFAPTGAAPARAADPAPSATTQPARRPTWELALSAAPRGWQRDPGQIMPTLRRLRMDFPDRKADLTRLALGIVRDPNVPDRLRFAAADLGLHVDPPPDVEQSLRIELAQLQAGYNCQADALATVAGIGHPEKIVVIRASRSGPEQSLANLIDYWKSRAADILATGRSYEAERLLEESDEQIDRDDYKSAAERLIKVATRFATGYLPQEDGSIISTGAAARAKLRALASKDGKAVAAAAEEASPGLLRRAGEGQHDALLLLATVYPFSEAGADALRRLGEEDLDAGRPQLAALRFGRLLAQPGDASAKAEAAWRLALARLLAGDSAGAEDAFARLAALRDAPVSLGGKAMTAVQAVAAIRGQFPPAATAPDPVAIQPDATLRPRFEFAFHPAAFDMDNRRQTWPRFWDRPESLARIDGDRAYFHDSRSVWAVDWRKGSLLWHFRQPGYLNELHHGERSFSNQINEAYQISRGYRVGVCGPYVAARLRRPVRSILFDLCGFRASDGAMLWTSQSSPDFDGLSISGDPVGAYDRFYVLAFSPIHISTLFVVCIEPSDGRVLWKVPVASGIDSFKSSIGNFFAAHGGIAVRDGRVFLSTDRGSFVALDALDGSLLWIAPTDRIFERKSYWGFTGNTTRADLGSIIEREHTEPVVGPGGVYLLSRDHPGLFAFRPDRGTRLFVDLPRVPVEILGLDGNRLIAAGRTSLFALDAATGELLWENPVASQEAAWHSPALHDGRVYLPDGDGLQVLSAGDGKPVGRIKVEGLSDLSSVRFLASGELAAFTSQDGIDRFAVLSASSTETIRLTEETAGLQTAPDSLVESDPAAMAAPVESVAERPAPLPPVRLLWRARFSPEQLFMGRYLTCLADDPTRLLVAAGDELRCYRFDSQGRLLWRARTPPCPQALDLWSGSRVCLRWTHGVEIFDLNTGRRLWGWDSASPRGLKRRGNRDRLASDVWGVADDLGTGRGAIWGRAVVHGISVPDGEVLWTYRVFNNSNQVAGHLIPAGLLMFLRQDRDYGGRAWVLLLGRDDGKVIWKTELAPNSYAWLRGGDVWTASADFRKLAMYKAGEKELSQVWTRDLGQAGDGLQLETDRLLVPQGRRVVVLDRATGKDVFKPIDVAGGPLIGGPAAYAARTRNNQYGMTDLTAWDRATGGKLWATVMAWGNPARPLFRQVAVPMGLERSHGGYWWAHVVRAYLGSILSIDATSGQKLGRWNIPGHNLWDVDEERGHQAIIERDNLILLRSEQGPVVLGAASLLTEADAARRLAAVALPVRTEPQQRELETSREAVMRYAAPVVACPRTDAAPNLDGEFDDWADARWIALRSPADWTVADEGLPVRPANRWAGPSDCSARFAVRHDGETLYVAVEVADDDFSPPPRLDPFTAGDSVEVGIALGNMGADALRSDNDRWYPDIKIMVAQVGGRPVVQPVYFGQGSQAAVSRRPGVARYEIAIPFASGRYRLADADRIGFALRVNDSDGGRPNGAIRWAGGLGQINAESQFGSLVLSPLSASEIAERRRVANLLPAAALSWELLYDVLRSHLALGNRDAASRELEDFLREHPDSYHASRCLAWSELLASLSGKSNAAVATSDLAARLKALPLEQAQAKARVFVQVAMPTDRHPTALGLRFTLKTYQWSGRMARGVYWGQNLGPALHGMVYAGPLPAGDRVELTAPAELLELMNHEGLDVTFFQRDGQAWWGDLGLIDAVGKRTVWVPADGNCTARSANWLRGKEPQGGPAHLPDDLGVVWSTHTWSPLTLAGNRDADAGMEAAGGTLPRDECLKAAWLIPDNKLALQLIQAVNDPEQAARFVRGFPSSQQVPALLAWLSGTGQGALADTLVDEGKIPRALARAFYAKVSGGIGPWLAVGPFSNEGDVGLRRVYPPETDPQPDAVYASGSEDLAWKKAAAGSDGFLNFAGLFSSDDFQLAYAMTWIHADQPTRAWVFVESPNVVSVWCGKDRLIENSEAAGDSRSSRRNRNTESAEPVPITLQPGWNRILLKVAGRWGYWGVKVRVGTAQGRPLEGLKFSAPPPGTGAREPNPE
ncbi:MAG: Outer membrane protein assembly factor BamB [Phycisphaerae bacterium]|nr:Outer membrane protein assembly factor BamB [Phycisphaerae bacterium]